VGKSRIHGNDKGRRRLNLNGKTMPKKRKQQVRQRARSGRGAAVTQPATDQLPTDEIFDGLRDRSLARTAAIKRLLELDCIDVLQFLDLSWVHTVANTGRPEFIGKRTNFAFDISEFPHDEIVLFRDWLTGAVDDDAVSVELLQRFVSVASSALRIWISDKRVDSLV
jgi:hypothetical protein